MIYLKPESGKSTPPQPETKNVHSAQIGGIDCTNIIETIIAKILNKVQDGSMRSTTCKQENEHNKAVYDEIFEENQVYWQVNLEKYSDSPAFGSEISSSIASAVKVYREKKLNPDKFKQKIANYHQIVPS